MNNQDNNPKPALPNITENKDALKAYLKAIFDKSKELCCLGIDVNRMSFEDTCFDFKGIKYHCGDEQVGRIALDACYLNAYQDFQALYIEVLQFKAVFK